AGRLSRPRRSPGTGGPSAVHPPEHHALPASQDRGDHGAQPLVAPRPLGADGRPDRGSTAPRRSRPIAPRPTGLAYTLSLGRLEGPSKSCRATWWPTVPRRRVRMWLASRVIALLAPGQGAQKPGMLTPWLELPGVAAQADALADAAGLDLVRLGT